MTDRPILFSGPMVRAILEGRKTQTRRVLKGSTEHKGPYNSAYVEHYQRSTGWAKICPYGQRGDRLWVRETTLADYEVAETIKAARYEADGEPVLYSGPEVDENGDDDYGGSHAHWWYSKDRCPSIHMPRWASRLTLEITAVRVERLQDITQEDAIAEGMNGSYMLPEGKLGGKLLSAQTQFTQLWHEINGKKFENSWDANPWVWVVEFKKCA